MKWYPLLIGTAVVAEVQPDAPVKWAAVSTAIALLTVMGERRRPDWSSISLVVLFVVAGIACQSALLLALTVPATLGQTSVVLLSLAAMGVHILWWNWLSVFRLERLPEVVAQAVSLVSGGAFHMTASHLYVGGQPISFSNIDPVPFVVVMLVATINGPQTLRTWVRAGTGVVIGCTCWLLIVALVGAHTHSHLFSAWWKPFVQVGIAAAATLLILGNACGTAVKSRVPLARFAAATVVAAAALVLAELHESSGSLTVAFDEAHGRWETAEGEFNTNTYGRDTVYNYVVLRQWLSGKHRVVLLDKPLTRIDADVLIIKTPTSFFSDAEKRVLDDFLNRGGTLVALGDHTNLFGTSFVLNDLLATYGLRIHYDATVPWNAEHFDYRPAWWHRTWAMRGIDVLHTQTAATITATSPRVMPFLVGNQVVGEDADYSNERFFGELHAGFEDRQPPVVFGAWRRVGGGRIYIFTDSTIFSNFSVMAPGNADLMQNILEAARTDSPTWAFGIVVIIGIAFGIGVRGWGRFAPIGALAGITLVAALTIPTVRASAERPLYPGRWIQIDQRHSRFTLHADPRVGREEEFEDYSTWFAWFSRLGLLPTVRTSASGHPAVPLVILNPDQPFTDADLARIENEVRAGRRLLLFDDPRFRVRSTAGLLLSRFGIDLRPLRTSSSIHQAAGRQLSESLLAVPFDLLRYEQRELGSVLATSVGTAYALVGVTALLTDSDGIVIAGEKEIGKGRVLVFGRSSIFSDYVMGDVWGSSDVSPERLALYDLFYQVVRRGIE